MVKRPGFCNYIKGLGIYQTHYNKICKVCTSKRKARWRAEHPSYMTVYHQAMKEPAIKKICVNCGVEYETNNPLQKLCRSDCQKTTIAEQYKEWRKVFPDVSKEVFRRLIFQKLKT